MAISDRSNGGTGMKLYGVRIFVDDFEAAKAFYTGTLGLRANWTMDAMKAMGLDVGAEIIVEQEDPASDEGQSLIGRFVGLSLQVDDIDKTYQELSAKGVPFTGPPAKQPWGGTLAHFQDPAGNTLTLLG